MRYTRDERRPRSNRLFHRVDRIIHSAGYIGLALETEWRSWRGLFFRQAVHPVIHDDVSHLDVLARGMIEMVAANRESIAVTAKHKHVQVWPRERDATRKGQGATMNVMRAVGLDEIRKAARTTDACDGRV